MTATLSPYGMADRPVSPSITNISMHEPSMSRRKAAPRPIAHFAPVDSPFFGAGCGACCCG